METRRIISAAVCAFLVLVGSAVADFSLIDQLTVDTYHFEGNLWGSSQASIVEGGGVGYLYAWDSSTVNMYGGGMANNLGQYNFYDLSTMNMSGGSVGWMEAYDSSTINFTDGLIGHYLRGYGSSIINISGGYVDTPVPHDFSTMNMSGGSGYWFSAEGHSTTNFSGGSIDEFYAVDSPIVNISGGSIVNLHVRDTSTSIFFGQNFQYGDGLILDGNRLLGTGVLSGEWVDGTPWSINILENESTASIQIVPEPATMALLLFGTVILRGKRTQRPT